MRKNIVFILFCFVVLFNIYAVNVSANGYNEQDYDELNTTKIEITERINFVEKKLSSKNSSVVQELENIIVRYEMLLLNENDEESYFNIQRLIDTTSELLDDYNLYKNNNRGVFDPIYSPIVAAAIAWFNNNNYYLSCELLTHARDNNDLDSIYYPVYGYRVLNSSIYTSVINSSNYYGASIFTKTGNTNDDDLYYSIKAFNYSKSESGRVCVIQDRYDFKDYDTYESFEDFLVDLIFEAQSHNVIIPFYNVIINNHFGTSINQTKYLQLSYLTKYYEDKVTLAQGEYKDYFITFDRTGFRTVQTFGVLDTILYVYDNNGYYVTGSDDGGYLLNSFVSYNFTANIQYKIRVYFYDSSVSGETKLAITPAVENLKSGITTLNYYSDIFNIPYNYSTYSTGFTQYYTKMVTFTPETNAIFNIYTSGNTDTYMYFIDPRSTYYRSDWENDDGGENFNAKITTQLSKNIDYLVIYSDLYLYSSNSSFTLVFDIS